MQEYQSFRIGTDGNLQGVGIFINAEPKTGHLVGNTIYLDFHLLVVPWESGQNLKIFIYEWYFSPTMWSFSSCGN